MQKYTDKKPEYLRRTSSLKANDDRIYTSEEREFMNAMQDWKEANNNYWPKWSDCLAVLLSLGYRKHPQGALASCPTCGESIPRADLPVTIPDPEDEEDDDPDDTPDFENHG